jgi:hypothetical protein
MRRIRSSYRKKAQAQLDASQKYKDGLRKEGIPLRDDLARIALERYLDRLADLLRDGKGERYEKVIQDFVKRLDAERFNHDKADAVVRAMVKRRKEQREQKAT